MMSESKWMRMKRKSYEEGLAEGRFRAFCDWNDGNVSPLELQSFRVQRCFRTSMSDALLGSVPASSPIAGLRFSVNASGVPEEGGEAECRT